MSAYPGVNELILNEEVICKIAESIAMEEIPPETRVAYGTVRLKYEVDTESESFKSAIESKVPRGCYVISQGMGSYRTVYEIKFTSDLTLWTSLKQKREEQERQAQERLAQRENPPQVAAD